MTRVHLNGDLIFHWISEKYPKAMHIVGSGVVENYQAERPMFWGNPEAMRGHLVVVQPDKELQIVHHARDAIFLCIGGDARALAGGRNEYILLPAGLPVEQVFNYVLEIFDRFRQWETLLRQAEENLLSYSAMIRSCDQMISAPMALTDSQFRYVEYSRRLSVENGWEDQYVSKSRAIPLDVINLLTALPEFRGLEQRRDVFVHVGAEKVLHKNIFDGERFVGRLSIPLSKNAEENKYNAQILTIVSGYVERLYARLGTFWHRGQADQQSKQMICELIRGDKAAKPLAKEVRKRLGCGEDDSFCLVQLQPHTARSTDKLNSVLAAHIEDLWPGSQGLLVDQTFYVLLNETKFRARLGRPFQQELAYFLRESLLLAGISRPFNDFLQLSAAAVQTEIALNVGPQYDPTYWYFYFDDYAFRYLLQSCCGQLPPEQVAAPEILLLEEYDLKNGTELNLTLRVYLECSYNAVRAAKTLNVARSTLLKRLERIEELTKLDLESFSRRGYLILSYLLLHPEEPDSAL